MNQSTPPVAIFFKTHSTTSYLKWCTLSKSFLCNLVYLYCIILQVNFLNMQYIVADTNAIVIKLTTYRTVQMKINCTINISNNLQRLIHLYLTTYNYQYSCNMNTLILENRLRTQFNVSAEIMRTETKKYRSSSESWGSYGSEYVDVILTGCNAVCTCR